MAERRGTAAAGVLLAAALLIAVAVGVHVRAGARRAELAELSKLARYDRWGIPVDEAVDNSPNDAGAEGDKRAARRTATDKMMLKTVHELEGKMDSLAKRVSRLDAARESKKSPVEREVVKVVHEHNDAELSALKAIESGIKTLIAGNAGAHAPAPATHERRAEAPARASEREREQQREEERAESKAEEIKDVEKRTMEAVKNAMAQQREIDMREAAAETERRQAARRAAAAAAAAAGPTREEHAREAPSREDRAQAHSRRHQRLHGEEREPQAKGRWGRRDGEQFDAILAKRPRASHEGGLVGRHGDVEGATDRKVNDGQVSTAVTSGSSLSAKTGDIRDSVLRLEKSEDDLEGQERHALNELPEISNDEAHAEQSVASTMQTLQIAKDRLVLARRAVENDSYNTGPQQAQEDRQTLVVAKRTEQMVSDKLKVDLHALAQAKLDAKRGPILAKALHEVRAELRTAKDKLKVWDQVQEAQSLEDSKDFAAR
jgi:hypothetical protein